jgi:hypothetical protein
VSAFEHTPNNSALEIVWATHDRQQLVFNDNWRHWHVRQLSVDMTMWKGDALSHRIVDVETMQEKKCQKKNWRKIIFTQYRDIPGESTQGWHHGSENLNQIFLMDSSIHLKYRFILAKLSKIKTRIFAAYLLKFSGFP